MAKTKLEIFVRIVLCLFGIGLAYFMIVHEHKYFGGFCCIGLVVMNLLEFKSYLKNGRDNRGNN